MKQRKSFWNFVKNTSISEQEIEIVFSIVFWITVIEQNQLNSLNLTIYH